MKLAPLALALLVCGALTACESTQDKSKRIGQQTVKQEQGLVVKARNRDVKVVSTKALQDENGAAAAVTVRNTSSKALTNLPIAITLRGAHGAPVFRNDQPGLETSLVAISALGPRQTLTWVHDQATPTGRARTVRARIGNGKPVSAPLPRVTFSEVKLEQDPVSGVQVVGVVSNRSKVEQRKLVIFAVARKGGRIVAAGRGQIKKVKPKARARFAAFFIGNPRGTRLSLSAPATAVS